MLKMFSCMYRRYIVPYVIVVILFNCSQPYSEGTFSVIDNIDENGNIIVRNTYSAFDFGQDFYVDEILQEVEDLGPRPGMINQLFKKNSREKCIDSCSSSGSSLRQVPEAGESDDYFQPITPVEQMIKQYKIQILDNSTSKKSVYDDSKASTESFSSVGSSSTNEVIEMIQAGNSDEISPSLKKIADFPGVSLDYSEDGEEDINIVHSVHERFADGVENSFAELDSREDETMSESVDEAMAESVSDILAPVKGERQARQFYNFNSGSAFNTSISFTIPLISFTLPGSGDVTPDGLDSNVFGSMALMSLFLLGGLGVAVYTTTLAGNSTQPRSFDDNFSGQQLLLGGIDESLATAVNSALLELSEALNLPGCSQLAACEAHLQPMEYGVVGLPFRIRAPLRPETPSEDLSPLEAAGRVGAAGGNCAWEFPCIVDPLRQMELVLEQLVETFS